MFDITMGEANSIMVLLLAVLAAVVGAWGGWMLVHAMRKFVVAVAGIALALVVGSLGVGLVLSLAPYIQEVNR